MKTKKRMYSLNVNGKQYKSIQVFFFIYTFSLSFFSFSFIFEYNIMVQQLARVQVTSRSWAKPAIPTPFIRGRTELSDWDVVMFATYMPLLLFYTNDYRDPNFMNTAILKSSLSETLVDFYPLAGRLIDVGNGVDAIDNNDEGVLFVVSIFNVY